MADTGIKYPGAVAQGSNRAGYDLTWTNPSNIQAADASNAFFTIDSEGNTASNALRATSLSMGVTAGSTINGIVVEIHRKGEVSASGYDAYLHLMKDGSSLVGSNKGDPAGNGGGGKWPTSLTTATYGSSSDLWGTTWTAAEVNAAGFGVSLEASALHTGQSLSVDFIRVTVYYTAPTAPAAPTLGTITPGNTQLSAAFVAGGDGGSAITSYKYSTDNGATYRTRQTGTTASPIVITTLSSDGTTPLANGTAYSVIIKAVNAIGDGTASNMVSATPSTTPSAPTLSTVTPGDAKLTAAFTAGATGGSAITSYKYSTDNGASYRTRQTGTTTSPIVITTLSSDGTTPLSNGVAYTVKIKAVNANGDGTASNGVAGTPSKPPPGGGAFGIASAAFHVFSQFYMPKR